MGTTNPGNLGTHNHGDFRAGQAKYMDKGQYTVEALSSYIPAPVSKEVVTEWDWKQGGTSIFPPPPAWEFLSSSSFSRSSAGGDFVVLVGAEYRDIIADMDAQVLTGINIGEINSQPSYLSLLKPLGNRWRIGAGVSYHSNTKISETRNRRKPLDNGSGLFLQVDRAHTVKAMNVELKLEYLQQNDSLGNNVNTSRTSLGVSNYF
ncbi:MAG: hypothetical protein OEZ68_01720 [Gammaproteobacteria bacterium]|nr:hypothetical protein [Gammaproteobacteria bacterium]MDH5799498.1 hypothetical protein [Gammaproteobacteria bacterium]